MQSVSGIGRIAALGAVVGAIVLLGIVLFGSGGGAYSVRAEFINASQLVKGNLVQVGGTEAGAVKDIKITPDGQAEVTLEIADRYAPLREGTKAVIRPVSLSGIANRYVDLLLPPGPDENNPVIADGESVAVDETTSPVELDQLFNTFPPTTRVAVQEFFKGGARQFGKQGDEANRGLQYLNPALSASSRVFRELNEDTPVLEAFLVDSARLVTALAERRDDLAGLVGNLNETTRALGNEKLALAEAISRFPGFMRTANTTFVNLRSTLDTLDPLVNASKPVVSRPGAGNDLRELLPELQLFAADAEPTVADLRRIVRHGGPNNDLIDLTNSFPPLASAALDTKRRAVAPGGRRFVVNNGNPVRGAFPEITDALESAADEIAFGRPYTPALFGWFDDFSTTGAGNDALGGISRTQGVFNATTFSGGIPITFANLGVPVPAPIAGALGPVLTGAGLIAPGSGLVTVRNPLLDPTAALQRNQYKRCPGANEEPATDGSNVLTGAERAALDCVPSDRSVGTVP